MITFQELTLSAFRSFRRPATFKFPLAPGLYFLGGRNEIEPHLSPNACGKSSLFDGLRWVLYGATARGAKAGDIAHWQGGKTGGRLKFKKDETAYTLIRRWRPNTLTLNGRNVTQSEIDDLMGMNADTFMGACFMGQFNRFFFDLGPAEKQAVFVESLGLGEWETYSRKAADKTKAETATATSLNEKSANLKGQLSALRAELIRERELEKESVARFLAERAAAFRQLAGAKAHLAECLKKQAAAQKQYDFQKHLIDEKRKGLEDFATAEREVEKVLQRREFQLSQTVENLKRAEKELAELTVSAVCPVCRRPMPENQLKKERAGVQAAVAALKAKAIGEQTEYDNAKARLDKIIQRNNAYRETTKSVGELEKYVTALRIDTANAARAGETVKQLTALLEKQQGDNPHTQRIAAIVAKGKALQRQLKETETALCAAQARALAFEFWVKEFKAVRLWLIDEALQQLTIEVNNYLPELGLYGWEISFAVERQTAAGGVSRGFNVFIQSPQSGKPVRWENWCGGETQRLRIAGAKGLSNLLRARAKETTNIEIWDEPTAHINAAGVDMLPAFFAERAKAEGRVIWWVDHRTVDSGEFTASVTVVKDKNGSRIED